MGFGAFVAAVIGTFGAADDSLLWIQPLSLHGWQASDDASLPWFLQGCLRPST